MKTVNFKIPLNPHDEDVKLYTCSNIELHSGLTVLVGCNGAGKTTLLHLLKKNVEDRAGSMLFIYDDRLYGGTNRIGELIHYNMITDAASMIMSSEGERIHQSTGILFSQIGTRIRKSRPKEVWILMDAVSSGLSLDNVIEIKDFVSFVQKEEPTIDFFFIVSTNEYEFADDSDCIDVSNFKHKVFKTYTSYRKFILKSREKKNKRYAKLHTA